MKKWAFYNTEKNLYLSRNFDYTDCVFNILFMDTKRDAIFKYWSLDFKNELAIVSVDIEMNPNFSEIVSKEEIEELDKPKMIVDQIKEQYKIDQHIVRKNQFEKYDQMMRKKWEECFRTVNDIKVKEYWIRGMRDNK